MAARPTGHAAARPPTISSPDFVGRTEEVAVLEHAVAQSAALVLVEGEAGVGKSRLVREFIASLQPRRALVAVCPPFRQPYTLAPVVDAVRQVTDGVSGLPVSALAGALRPLFPEWAADLPATLEPAEDVQATRHRLLRALIELLDCLDVAVLVVEDVHWADEATLEFLLLLTSRQVRRPTVVVTYRPEDVPADSLLLRLSSRAPAGGVRHRVSLDALDMDETARLVSSMLDGKHVSKGFAAFLHERTEGLPLAVEETVRLMHERADLTRRGGEWVRRQLTEIDVPPTVRDAVLERAGRLDPDVQAVLQAAAVLAEPASEATLLSVTGIPLEAAEAGLGAALDCGLMVEDARRLLSFRHTLAARAIYEAISAPQRRALHRRAGRVLEGASSPPAAQLARHFREARDTANWCRYAEQAADLALSSADEAAAITLLHDLLTNAELPASSLARLTNKIPLSTFTGPTRFAELVRTLRSVLDTSALQPAEEASVRFHLGRVLSVMEDYEAGRAEMERAIPNLPARSLEAAHAMTMLGWARGTTWTGHEHLRWLRRAAEVLATIAPDARLGTAVDRGAGLLLLGEEEGWAEAEQVPADATSPTHRPHVTRANLNLGDLAMRWGRYDEARLRLQQASESAERYQYLRYRDVIAATELHLDWFTGAWDGLAERAAAHGSDMQFVTALEPVLVTGLLLAVNGESDRAGEQFRRVLEESQQHGAIECVMEPAAALARLHLAEDRVDEALRVTDEPIRILTHKHIWLWATELAPPRVGALAAVGDLAGAAAVVAAFARWLHGRNTPAPRASLTLCHAIIAEARGDHAFAADQYARAAAAWRALPRPYDALLADEGQARCLLRCDQRESALGTLADARDGLASLGAVGDADRLTRTLRQHGVRTRSASRGGRRGYGDRLSPREIEVVRLVATGLTNREVADSLCRSPKTVATQLTSAMRKLQVSSRTALAVSAMVVEIVSEGRAQGAAEQSQTVASTPNIQSSA
jgi:DNA-binding CsgD family transcriptional regulator/tetratricopeptide (TPR) repeat protein